MLYDKQTLHFILCSVDKIIQFNLKHIWRKVSHKTIDFDLPNPSNT